MHIMRANALSNGNTSIAQLSEHARTPSTWLRDCASSIARRARATCEPSARFLYAAARRLMASWTVARMPSGSAARAWKKLPAISTSLWNTSGARCTRHTG